MKVLGAILAGGKSSRFGADKAVALFRGRPLIAHAIEMLDDQCDAVVVVGRDYPGIECVPDRPAPDCGPLGGVAGALDHALRTGFDLVLTCGVDNMGLPVGLLHELSPAPAYVATQPVLGLWRADSAGVLASVMTGQGRHSMRALAEAVGARPVKLSTEPANVNTPDDLARWEQAHGL